MKKTTIFAAILAAALLTGCGEDKPLDSTSSSSTTSSTSSSSSTTSTSSSTTSSSSSSTSSSSSSTSSSSSSTSSTSTSSSTTSSSSAAESSTSSSELVPDWYTGSTTSSSATPEPKPIQSSSSSTPTPNPTQSSTSSTFSSPTTDPITDLWNPNGPGCTPGPYGGYYDASGNLHCKKANMPKDEHGYPLLSYIDEIGQPRLSYAEMQEYIEEERRIAAGGDPDLSYIDWSLFP